MLFIKKINIIKVVFRYLKGFQDDLVISILTLVFGVCFLISNLISINHLPNKQWRLLYLFLEGAKE